MLIGVCGLGNTGSFAVIDLLREYSELEYSPLLHEFSFCYCPDGIADLEYHLVKAPARFQSSDLAFYRFQKVLKDFFNPQIYKDKKLYAQIVGMCENYLQSITQVSWQGTWGARIRDYSAFKKLVYKVLFKTRSIFGEKFFLDFTNEEMRYSNNPENFLEITKEFIDSLLRTIVEDYPDKKGLIIDQMLPGDNPEPFIRYYKDPYAIVVDRDPRDLYILSKYEIHSDSTWIPTDDVESFIAYYRNMRKKNYNNQQILRIQYEDLIYEYERTIKVLEDFLGVSDHKNPKRFFVPEVSINNTQLFIKHKECAEDVKKIETELKDWLYDYSKYPVMKSFGKTW